MPPERRIVLRDENGKEIPRPEKPKPVVPAPTPAAEFPSITTFSMDIPEGMTEQQKLERVGLVAMLYKRGLISKEDAERTASELFPDNAPITPAQAARRNVAPDQPRWRTEVTGGTAVTMYGMTDDSDEIVR